MGKVNATFCLHEHNVLITGGDDGVVSFWKASDMTPLHKVRLESPSLGGKPAPVSSITTDSKSKALVGTKCGGARPRVHVSFVDSLDFRGACLSVI